MRMDDLSLVTHHFNDETRYLIPTDPFVRKARSFAINAHGSQMYGNSPYLTHLEDVVAVASCYGSVAAILGYLHDVVEDAGVSLKKIEEEFGSFIAACVGFLTDPAGETRAERKAALNENLARIRFQYQIALIVKAADRFANVRACLANGNAQKLSMYRDEHACFRLAAFRPRICDEIWIGLDGLINAT